MTEDPYVRVVGELPDSYSDEAVVVGVDHDAVTIQLGEWPAIMLASAQAEDFARLFIKACWEAAAQSATLAQAAELKAAAEEMCLADCGGKAHDDACREEAGDVSPIRPENRDRYPPDWPEISKRIRYDRAQGRCECTGICGEHLGRCTAVRGLPHPDTGSRVVLTVAHLDHTPENCAEQNLAAMCQRCHLAYDAEHHAQTAARTRAAAATAGMEPLL